MIKRVLEVDPLLCERCGGEMRIIAFIVDHQVIDKILRHRKQKQLTSPFESRAPPAA